MTEMNYQMPSEQPTPAPATASVTVMDLLAKTQALEQRVAALEDKLALAQGGTPI